MCRNVVFGDEQGVGLHIIMCVRVSYANPVTIKFEFVNERFYTSTNHSNTKYIEDIIIHGVEYNFLY